MPHTQTRQSAAPGDVVKKIRRYFNNDKQIFDRMNSDYENYWVLNQWQPDEEDNITDEDSYTTNQPRVLAQKIIAFIAETELILRVPNDDAPKDQEERNKLTEALGIGMLANVDRRKRRNGENRIQRQMAWQSVVRGRYVAARSFLRKRENGDTYEDILPIDPAQLVFQPGEEEPIWAAHRRQLSRDEIRDDFVKKIGFENQREDDGDEVEEVFDYYVREANPFYIPEEQDNPFLSHPYIYKMGTLINDQWAAPLRNVFTLSFPVVISPVGSEPVLTPNIDSSTEKMNKMRRDFGESIFAENRSTWDKFNRVMSYTVDMVSKASDPPTKVFSSDGTKELEEGATEKGAQISLAVGDQQGVDLFETPDMNRVAGLLLEVLQRDLVGGGLPPQAFGLLDKPLSSVALRQLGNNLEHRVLPRMEAVQLCIEGCLEVLVAQYETGAFEPITVSGRRFDRHRFSNKEIKPFEIYGHDALTVTLELALPEDETIRWNVANMAMQPTVTGEPLASLEYVREHILNIQDPKLLTDQNLEKLTRQTAPVLMLLDQYRAAIKDGDQMAAAALMDQIRVAVLQQQVQGSLQMLQLAQMAQGLPPMTELNIGSITPNFAQPDVNTPGQQQQPRAQDNSRNPAAGGLPVASLAGVGNQPSPQAGANTTASRQSFPQGLVDNNGNPIGTFI